MSLDLSSLGSIVIYFITFYWPYSVGFHFDKLTSVIIWLSHVLAIFFLQKSIIRTFWFELLVCLFYDMRHFHDTHAENYIVILKMMQKIVMQVRYKSE